MLIGLTGKYCAGKNFAAAHLQKRGIPVLDVDKLGHIVIDTKKTEILARFGQDLLNLDGSVNRRLLAEKIFKKTSELAALEAIVHPEVNRLTEQWIKGQKCKNCAINAALLHKSIVFNKLACIILIKAPWFIRLIRAKRRDKLPWHIIFNRMSSQKKFNSQYSAGKADIYKVENSCLKQAKLGQKIDAVLEKTGLLN